ncbi:ABC transporter ATP-binding protein [Diplocloster modestus]|uniref:ABC transporter ATP-binding protein n=1 Tax=Diplocloster modestus TaxID=2850322 RepID=A0ABS6KBI0_9FIRM|nr:ABC transporter ATP-binding protein [Diplocloster modestus]MBU9727879.1 ABC transporter ATP-binding protein [Diplocloster modestus]
MQQQKTVEMKNIHKQFPFVKAVDGARFDLFKGEIHSLIGENGAGKSTMMKILYGMYPIDQGEIFLNGEKVDLSKYNTHSAIQHGIGMVHQEFMLVKEMTVLENIILGVEPTKGNSKMALDFTAARKKINHYIENYQMNVHLDRKVLNISVGEMQRVEIIKALYRGADVLILDEPTAVLTPQETDKLFEILDIMRKDGVTIVFISHKLKEVMAISDRISVMRGGRYVATVDKSDTTIPELAKMMVGREVFLDGKRSMVEMGEPVLQVKNVYVPSERELSKNRDISFVVRAGEVLGVAGIDGNGQSELGEAIAGLRPVEKGEIILGDKVISNKAAHYVRDCGLAHIPEDRNDRGLNKEHTVTYNLVAAEIGNAPFSKYGIISEKEMRKVSEERIERFDIRPRDPRNLAMGFSGGNAQKIVVARELGAPGKKLLLAAQPTRGVDIGSIEGIRKLIDQAKREGLGVLLISADIDEILALSDRIIVMYEGRISGEVVNDENLTDEKLGMLMLGGESDAKSEV